jgi:hypothetical protein
MAPAAARSESAHEALIPRLETLSGGGRLAQSTIDPPTTVGRTRSQFSLSHLLASVVRNRGSTDDAAVGPSR